MVDNELAAKVALINEAVERDGIDAIREAVLCFWMSSYIDSGHADILEQIETTLRDGFKGTANMTPEELAHEISLDEAHIILGDENK